MSLPTDLLAQALKLATFEETTPKQASLRRSVSAAYYALFHFISEESVNLFLGTGNDKAAMRHLARRSIAHTRLREVCTEFLKETPRLLLQPFWEAAQIAGDSDFADLCGGFIDLQKARHVADYDLSTPVSRSKAQDAHAQATRAMGAWMSLKECKPDGLHLFAMAVLLWPGLSNR